MEITSTTVTRTARHTTAAAHYNIDYSVIDGRLDRVGLNIFRPPHEDVAERHLGSVHYDGHNIACHLPMEDDLADLFETAVGFVAEIIESVAAGGVPGASGAPAVSAEGTTAEESVGTPAAPGVSAADNTAPTTPAGSVASATPANGTAATGSVGASAAPAVENVGTPAAPETNHAVPVAETPAAETTKNNKQR